jgi:hypothetical protein
VVPIADWTTIAARFAASLADAGMSVDEVSAQTAIPRDDVQAFVDGDPVLGAYELEQLAEALNLTVGTWFCEDQAPLFRGKDDEAAAAATLGVELMTEYLAVEALAG